MAPALIYKTREIIRQIACISILVIGYWLLAIGEVIASDHVRVAITQNENSIRLKVNGGYEVIEFSRRLADGKVLYRGRNLNTTVTAYKGGILLGNIKSRSGRLFINPDEPDDILIDGRKFRGGIQFIKKDNARLSAVNYIELEDYIKGILYHEASHYWPIEVLKAQAITCRTYAVYQMRQNKAKDYDVTSDIYSQVYGGRASERSRTNEAVNETASRVLVYRGEVFPAYFHATCAGHTEDAAVLWDIDLSPLKGVACVFCKDSPHFSWHLVLDRGELRQRLVNAGRKMGMIKNIGILGKDASGRIVDLKITTTTSDLRISAKDFRNIIGPNEIRSTNFAVDLAGEDFVFEGVGWGHGVGLCQWGGYFMAKQGRSAEEILKYYYPGAEISLILNP